MILGAPGWLWPAVSAGAVFVLVVLWSYVGTPHVPRLPRAAGAVCKAVGVALLLFCLTEPLVERERARPGANHVLVLADSSKSLAVVDDGAGRSRAEVLTEALAEDSPWLVRLGQDFDVTSYAFDEGLRSLDHVSELDFEGDGSALHHALERVGSRWADRPVAAIVVLTDGLATDVAGPSFEFSSLPPVYPVLAGGRPERDLSVTHVDVTQTQFEETPVTLRARVRAVDGDGEDVRVELLDEAGEVLETKLITLEGDRDQEVRFDAPLPEDSDSGLLFYSVRASYADGASEPEATKENNSRWAVVDRGAGDHRVLYVSGRPNWEFKFLRRAMEEDPEVGLVGMLRIARSQPRFTFRAGADRRNQLWDGFDNRDEEVGEQVDEPVFVRIGTRDGDELRRGFPTTSDELFAYDGLILDDLEAPFFTNDQLTLIEDYVGRRGGGLLVLGGEQSYTKGGYRRTPLGDLLPVYLEGRASDGSLRAGGAYDLELTREGWLEPWVRLHADEELERRRLASMPSFRTLNRVGDIKPGGAVLMEARAPSGELHPALVAQRFGNGRSAAMLVGDLWRWDLGRPEPESSALGTAWRQLLRWLVADVPRRVELEATRDEATGRRTLRATLRDESFEAIHDADCSIVVTSPGQETVTLYPTPSSTEPGLWTSSFTAREPGPYRAELVASGADGAEIGREVAGWIHEPAAEELRRLNPDHDLAATLASSTGGRVLAPEDLNAFAEGLSLDDVPITEQELDPLWHRLWMFLLAIAFLTTEWGLRRFQGMP